MSHIESENNGAVRRITINRPEKKNALTAEMYEDLSDALEKAESAPEVRVMLLHGAGEAFTAGNDLVDFLQEPWKGQDLPPAVRFIRAVVDRKKAYRRCRTRGDGGNRHHDPAALRPRLCGGEHQVPDALHQPRHRSRSRLHGAFASAHRPPARG